MVFLPLAVLSIATSFWLMRINVVSAECSKDQFTCYSSGNKCIPKGYLCDYDNDCGNNEDELYCSEKCTELYTNWEWAQEQSRRYNGYIDYGGTKFLDKQWPKCDEKKVMKYFQLESRMGRSGITDGVDDDAFQALEVRYKYKCCTLLRDICNIEKKVTYYGDNGGGMGNTVFLDRHQVWCNDGLLHSFSYQTSPSSDEEKKGFLRQVLNLPDGVRQIRYVYECCKSESHHLRCERKYTPFNDDGKMKNEEDRNVRYLDRHKIECPYRDFVSQFKLERHSDHRQYRYSYLCCHFWKNLY